MEEIKNSQSKTVDQKCPKCNVGYMRENGIVFMTNPQKYQHRCTNCGHEETYGVRYPYVITC